MKFNFQISTTMYLGMAGFVKHIYVSFASSARDKIPFIDTPRGFVDHPSHRAFWFRKTQVIHT